MRLKEQDSFDSFDLLRQYAHRNNDMQIQHRTGSTNHGLVEQITVGGVL